MKMSRRDITTFVAASALTPFAAMGQTPDPDQTEIDRRSRNLVDALDAVKPTELLTTLETAPIAQEGLHELAGGNATPIPWTDFNDRDLRNALGGVMVGGQEDTIDNLVGGYVVFESAEIAYHELIVNLQGEYAEPDAGYSTAGTFVWEIKSSANLRIGLTRIGYVQIIAVERPGAEGVAMPLLIEHLTKVAQEGTR